MTEDPQVYPSMFCEELVEAIKAQKTSDSMVSNSSLQ